MMRSYFLGMLAQPAPRKPPPICVDHRLRCIEMIARIDRTSPLWSKATSVVGANDVLGSAPSVVDDREHEDMAVDESEEVWAFPHGAGMFYATLKSGQKWTHVLPIHQVGGAVVQHRTPLTGYASPYQLMEVAVFHPNGMVAEPGGLQTPGNRGYDGIAAVLAPRSQQLEVIGPRKARQLGCAATSRVQQVRDVILHSRAAGPATVLVGPA